MATAGLNGCSLTWMVYTVGSSELLVAQALPDQQLHDALFSPSDPTSHPLSEPASPRNFRARSIRSLGLLWIVSSKPLKKGSDSARTPRVSSSSKTDRVLPEIVKFDTDQLPPILNALTTQNAGNNLVLEVAVSYENTPETQHSG